MSSEPRVLIIEDHDALRAMLFAVLRHQQLAVDTAASVTAALDKVATCDYALILIDMSLARGGADRFFETFKRIRPASTSFIIAVRDPNREYYIDADVVSAVLNKPIELDTLSDVVRECAAVVPPPDDPLRCPPAESESRDAIDGASHLAN